MGLSGCCGIIKHLVVLVNLIFWLLGLAIVVLSVWMLTDPTFLIAMTQTENHYYIGLYMFLAIGALMVIVAFLGCCGAFKESQCMLVSFFCCLLVILVAEVAAGAWAVHNKDELDNMIRSSVKNTVQEEYGVVQTRTVTFDTIQRHLECCGANGPSDWQSSKYNKVDKTNLIDLTISKINPFYSIPESCCKITYDRNVCEGARKTGIASSINPAINTKGCMDKLVDEINKHATIVIGIGIGIILIEIFGLIFSLVLCFAIRSNDHYKA